jgi:hypothetical protein
VEIASSQPIIRPSIAWATERREIIWLDHPGTLSRIGIQQKQLATDGVGCEQGRLQWVVKTSQSYQNGKCLSSRKIASRVQASH